MNALQGTTFLFLVLSCSAQSTENDCKSYEEYRQSGCEVTCESLLKDLCFGAERKPGCYCKRGTVRNEEGQCISLKQCSEQVCTKPNQRLDLSGCFTVCTGEGTSYSGCPFRAQPSCTCERGFAVAGGGIRGDCIPVSQCTGLGSKKK